MKKPSLVRRLHKHTYFAGEEHTLMNTDCSTWKAWIFRTLTPENKERTITFFTQYDLIEMESKDITMLLWDSRPELTANEPTDFLQTESQALKKKQQHSFHLLTLQIMFHFHFLFFTEYRIFIVYE